MAAQTSQSWQEKQYLKQVIDLYQPTLTSDPTTRLTRVTYPTNPTYTGVSAYFKATPEVDVPMAGGRTKEWNIFTLDQFWVDPSVPVSDTWLIHLTGQQKGQDPHPDLGGYWKVQGNSRDLASDPTQDVVAQRWVYAKRGPEPAWLRGATLSPIVDPFNYWAGFWSDLCGAVVNVWPEVKQIFRGVDAREVNWYNGIAQGLITVPYVVIDLPTPTRATGWGMIAQRYEVTPTVRLIAEEDNTDLAAALESRLWALEKKIIGGGFSTLHVLGTDEADATQNEEATASMLEANMPLRAGGLRVRALVGVGVTRG